MTTRALYSCMVVALVAVLAITFIAGVLAH
jgi:hypothetical protein